MDIPVRDRIDFVEPRFFDIPIYRQCELLDIPKSSYYFNPKGESDNNLQIMNLIDQIHTDIPFYGCIKITKQINDEKHFSFPVNHKCVERLMRIMGISAVFPGKNLSKPNKQHFVYPYLLKSKIIDRPNQVWGVDITYIRMNRGFMYLVAIIDWYSRYVLSWNLSNTLEVGFCAEALEKALKIGMPDIHNSDQGSQFTSAAYLVLLHQYPEIQISMDGRGRCFDNIFTERLWRSLKYEEVYLKEYLNGLEARESINQYLNFYNNKRFHQSLNYHTPAEIYFKNC